MTSPGGRTSHSCRSKYHAARCLPLRLPAAAARRRRRCAAIRPARQRYRGLLWLVAAAFFMQALDSTIVNTAVPAMAEALGVTPLGMRTRADQLRADAGDPDPGQPLAVRPLRHAPRVRRGDRHVRLGSLLCGWRRPCPSWWPPA